jgi:FkbM family methyltransferase
VLAPDDRVLEAGGGTGAVAQELAILCARVWSVEADPVSYDVLTTVAGDAGVIPLWGALMIANGTSEADFYRHWHRPGSSLLPIADVADAERIRVPVIDAGRLIREHAITALVLDIERYEYELLSDLPELAMIRALVVEWHPDGIPEGMILYANEALAKAGLKLVAEDLSAPPFPVGGYVRA